MKSDFYALIMAGGGGTRFWPLSRFEKPKQFLPLVGEKSMLLQTLERISPIFDREKIFISTNITHASLVRREVSLSPENVIGEPVLKDTAPCIAYFTTFLEWLNPGSTFVALPSDHHIKNQNMFRKTLLKAYEFCQDGCIVLLGIKPDSPQTRFGYIKKGRKIRDRLFEIERFCEKPDKKTAQRYFKHRGYLWNGGIYISRADVMLEAIRKAAPEIYKIVSQIKSYFGTPEREIKMREIFERVPKISIEYSVIEKVKNIAVIEAEFDWSDVGDWEAIADIAGKDKKGNFIRGKFCGIDTKDCLIFSDNNHLVTTIGVKDLIIVNTQDATLICHRKDSQKIKDLVNMLKEKGLKEHI